MDFLSLLREATLVDWWLTLEGEQVADFPNRWRVTERAETWLKTSLQSYGMTFARRWISGRRLLAIWCQSTWFELLLWSGALVLRGHQVWRKSNIMKNQHVLSQSHTSSIMNMCGVDSNLFKSQFYISISISQRSWGPQWWNAPWPGRQPHPHWMVLPVQWSCKPTSFRCIFYSHTTWVSRGARLRPISWWPCLAAMVSRSYIEPRAQARIARLCRCGQARLPANPPRKTKREISTDHERPIKSQRPRYKQF